MVPLGILVIACLACLCVGVVIGVLLGIGPDNGSGDGGW
jgi:hypothetical protein